jgi:uncharacterized membrane protein YgcG
VARGDQLTGSQRTDLDRAIRAAEQASRAEFSVFVGHAGPDPRAHALLLHGSLTAPARSILILVDPSARALEVVTGSDVRRQVTDQQVGLAILAMSSAFADGDLVDGLRRGLNMLAEAARPQRTLHAH